MKTHVLTMFVPCLMKSTKDCRDLSKVDYQWYDTKLVRKTTGMNGVFFTTRRSTHKIQA